MAENKTTNDKPFGLKARFSEPELIGLRWWQESVAVAAVAGGASRRSALKTMLWVGGAVGAAGLVVALVNSGSSSPSKDLEDDSFTDSARDALELQKADGWNVGKPDSALSFPGAMPTDVSGSTEWPKKLANMAVDLSPAQPDLQPYYVSTLFQSVTPKSSESLVAALKPINDVDMDKAYKRGEALAAVLAKASKPEEIAVVLDIPGHTAVAAAAGMADTFDPVFLFDNWPHPLGVVPSHLTLGAAVYYQPRLLEAKEKRKGAKKPIVFVLDSTRLNKYVDDQKQFDNRYLARVPTTEKLQALGIKRVLYVVPNSTVTKEQDDLNDDFVKAHKAKVDVKTMALDDFRQPELVETDGLPTTSPYYWGGSDKSHGQMLATYGWNRDGYNPRPTSEPNRTTTHYVYRPSYMMWGWMYFATYRQTMFYGGRPSGFGHVPVRTYRSGGRSYSYSPSRSGSFNRGGSYSG